MILEVHFKNEIVVFDEEIEVELFQALYNYADAEFEARIYPYDEKLD